MTVDVISSIKGGNSSRLREPKGALFSSERRLYPLRLVRHKGSTLHMAINGGAVVGDAIGSLKKTTGSAYLKYFTSIK